MPMKLRDDDWDQYNSWLAGFVRLGSCYTVLALQKKNKYGGLSLSRVHLRKTMERILKQAYHWRKRQAKDGDARVKGVMIVVRTTERDWVYEYNGVWFSADDGLTRKPKQGTMQEQGP